MAVKHYVDDIPTSEGRVYVITTSYGKSTIRDATEYEQKGSSFGAGDINCIGVLECNYSKKGTVHALTTENVLSENIKFFATSAFTRGDTFTFNGVAVTARTTDGKELDTNFFVANSIVDCFRKNNTLYFGSLGKSIIDDTTGVAYHFGIDGGKLYIEED